MTDEQSNTPSETTSAEPPVTPAKKQRAPRRSKEEISQADASNGSKSGRAKLSSKNASSTVQSSDVGKANRELVAGALKANRKQTGLKESSDLAQLEEENTRLRKALAEKLRAENADLRKRLGD